MAQGDVAVFVSAIETAKRRTCLLTENRVVLDYDLAVGKDDSSDVAEAGNRDLRNGGFGE